MQQGFSCIQWTRERMLVYVHLLVFCLINFLKIVGVTLLAGVAGLLACTSPEQRLAVVILDPIFQLQTSQQNICALRALSSLPSAEQRIQSWLFWTVLPDSVSNRRYSSENASALSFGAQLSLA